MYFDYFNHHRGAHKHRAKNSQSQLPVSTSERFANFEVIAGLIENYRQVHSEVLAVETYEHDVYIDHAGNIFGRNIPVSSHAGHWELKLF
jgi:hypothetical protein